MTHTLLLKESGKKIYNLFNKPSVFLWIFIIKNEYSCSLTILEYKPRQALLFCLCCETQMTDSWGINFNLVLAIWFLKLQTDFKIWANLHVLHLCLEFWNFALSTSCKLECKLEWMKMVVRPSLRAWEIFFCSLTIEEHDCYWRNSCSWKVWLLNS